MKYSSHPLADIFPLIEGKEFDELVTSIRDHGLREPIVLFEGKVLDGRNRYRACEKAVVEPRFDEFTGDDPLAYVADKNLHRRQLTPAQSAMVAARMANLSIGRPETKKGYVKPISLDEAATLLGVSRSTVKNARLVLQEGTESEVSAADRGEVGVSTLAHNIRERDPRDRRSDRKDKPQKRTEALAENHRRKQLNAQMWGHLRDGLNAIASLPRASDVVAIARTHDRAGVVDAKLFQSLQWMKDFAHEWSKRNQASAEEEQPANDHPDAGAGERVAGT